MHVNARHLDLTVREDPDGRYFSVTRMRPLVAAGRAADLRRTLRYPVGCAGTAMVPVPPGRRVKGVSDATNSG